MGIIEKLKRLFTGSRYLITRSVLEKYIDEVIGFARNEGLSFCDEFYLTDKEDYTERLHVCIINYDAEDGSCLESEKDLTGVIIFVNDKKSYDPANDSKYYSARQFIECVLPLFPEKFILENDLGEPKSLEAYKI